MTLNWIVNGVQASLKGINMQKQNAVLRLADLKCVKIKSIRRVENEDVYCLASEKNGTMIANGIITRQCDALRYAVCSAFPTGEFANPDDDINYDRYRRKVLGSDEDSWGGMIHGGMAGY